MAICKKALLALALLAIVGGMATSAMAIEAFQERFEWGDLSQPTTLHGRVFVIDPYDKAVWISVAVFGGNAESGLYWQKIHPGKTLKFYAANDEVLKQLQGLGRPGIGPTAMANVPPGSKTTLIEFVAKETEQNHRVISSVKSIEEVAGSASKPRSIHSLRSTTQAQAIKEGSWPQNRKMLYDVLIPDGKAIAGFIPNSNQQPHSVSK
ncbi:MAG: hypothetical protein GKS05_06380 [Nitrospirales bacterium]|nr:hypothetical protein [Nitrospirales bacterium]